MAIELAAELVRKAQVVGILEHVCQALELTAPLSSLWRATSTTWT